MENLTIGRFLKSRREQKGFSLRKASDVTKIHQRLLLSLESDDFARLPKLIYLRGFIRNLADVLDFDSAEALLLLEKNYSHFMQESIGKTHSNSRSFHLLCLQFKDFLSLLWYFSRFFLKPKVLVLVFLFAGGLTFLFMFNNYFIDHKWSNQASNVELKKEATPEVKKQGRSEINIEVTTRQNCWIAYKVDTNPIISLTLKPEVKLFLKGENIRLVLGRPQAVKVFKNNSPVDIGLFVNPSGTASLIFPENLKEKYQSPFFVFQENGKALTLNEHIRIQKTN